MMLRALTVLIAVLGLTGCVFPGEADDGHEVSFRFVLPDREEPVEIVFSEADQIGLGLVESAGVLERIAGGKLAILLESSIYSTEDSYDEEYCLLDDVLIRDLGSGRTEIGFEAGSCFYGSRWVHPDVQE